MRDAQIRPSILILEIEFFTLLHNLQEWNLIRSDRKVEAARLLCSCAKVVVVVVIVE